MQCQDQGLGNSGISGLVGSHSLNACGPLDIGPRLILPRQLSAVRRIAERDRWEAHEVEQKCERITEGVKASEAVSAVV